jgi:hypothetical protein
MNPPSWFDARVGSDFQVFWEDGERIFCRARRDGADGDGNSVLAILLAVEHPTPDSLKRLANEYALKGELEDAWAVRPLDLVREGGADTASPQGSWRRAARSLARLTDGDR